MHVLGWTVETVNAEPTPASIQSAFSEAVRRKPDAVVTTGFANLSDGAKITVGTDDKVPVLDLAPKRRGRRDRSGRDGQPRDNQPKESQAKDGQAKDGAAPEGRKRDWQKRDGQDGEGSGEHRHRHRRDEGDEKAPAQGNEAPSGAAKSQQ